MRGKQWPEAQQESEGTFSLKLKGRTESSLLTSREEAGKTLEASAVWVQGEVCGGRLKARVMEEAGRRAPEGSSGV